MSEDNKVTDLCCAACGIAEIDEIKLMECDDCDLVRYCSDECREGHKFEHEAECKKRAAELRDESLFKQPESTHMGDCPICSLPMPLDLGKSMLMGCCGKVICRGCEHANQKREIEERLGQTCLFCRECVPKTEEEFDKLRMKRVEANDPVAMTAKGTEQYDEGDYRSSFQYFVKAAELGDAEAHYRLACLYHNGEGVEKDEGKEINHLEEASIGGHPGARHILGCIEFNRGNIEMAMKHHTIAATQGDEDGLKCLMEMFKMGFVRKDYLATVLRAHQAAVDATKSPQREAVEEFYRVHKNLRAHRGRQR